MDRIPPHPPIIPKLANESVDRPLWSVMIPVYNCAHYLTQTLRSVLEQDPGPALMQIEVVDDASTDADVEALVGRLGRGRVAYYRQEQNVGSLRNFETCLNRSRGQLVHLLHGDDRVRPGFYRKFELLFEQFPEVGAAFCRYRHIDEAGNPLSEEEKEIDADGLIPDWLLKIAERQRLQYVCSVVKRSVYEHLGSFYGVTYGEDWEMWVRIARYYPVAYTPELLAEYRVHESSISSAKMQTGQTVRDLKFLTAVIKEHIPAPHKHSVSRRSTRIWAHYELGKAKSVWEQTRNRKQVRVHIAGILSLHASRDVYWRVCKLYIKMVAESIWSKTKPAKPTGSGL